MTNEQEGLCNTFASLYLRGGGGDFIRYDLLLNILYCMSAYFIYAVVGKNINNISSSFYYNKYITSLNEDYYIILMVACVF